VADVLLGGLPVSGVLLQVQLERHVPALVRGGLNHEGTARDQFFGLLAQFAGGGVAAGEEVEGLGVFLLGRLASWQTRFLADSLLGRLDPERPRRRR